MKTINQRKQNWIDLYAKKRRRVFKIDVNEFEINRPRLWQENKQARIDFALKKYENLLEQSAWLDDDSLPYLDMLTGTEIFAEALGSKVYKHPDTNPCAIAFIHNPIEASKVIIPDLQSSTLGYLFEMADTLYEKAGSDALMRLVDIQSPIDIAAIMWEKTDFYTSLISAPEAIIELCQKIRIFLMSFLDEWFRRYKKEFIAHYPAYYMPYGITLSEDEVGAISPSMFDEFFLDELVQLSNRYGQIGIHCCADSDHQRKNFLKIPNLVLLNLHREVASTRESLELYKNHTVLMPAVSDVRGIENAIQHFPKDEGYIALWGSADNKSKALRKLDLWRELFE